MARASRRVDREDPRVRVRAAHGVPPEHPGGVQVARVRELAGDLGDGVGAARGRRRVPDAGACGSRCSPLGRQVDGVEDLLVPGAAAEIPGERLADLVVATGRGRGAAGPPPRRRSPGVQKPHCTAPASANASCTGCSVASPREPFDRDDVVAVRLCREDEARADELAVEEHRARAALALLARVLRAGKVEAVAERRQQALAGPDVRLAPLAVDRVSSILTPARQCTMHSRRHLSSARCVRTRRA